MPGMSTGAQIECSRIIIRELAGMLYRNPDRAESAEIAEGLVQETRGMKDLKDQLYREYCEALYGQEAERDFTREDC